MINQTSSAIFNAEHTLFFARRLGSVEVVPVERIVVVPGVTAVIVGCPSPVIQAKLI